MRSSARIQPRPGRLRLAADGAQHGYGDSVESRAVVVPWAPLGWMACSRYVLARGMCVATGDASVAKQLIHLLSLDELAAACLVP